jgi:uncharacterized pyridoxal phosphate-containing UPF0001 family protein
LDVCKHIKENCPALEIYGLMTIGMKDRDAASNPDFEVFFKYFPRPEKKFGLLIYF